MILKETLRAIVNAQASELSQLDAGIRRGKLAEVGLDMPFANVIAGVRRCGKSTFMRQLIKKAKGYCYFNFEDPRAVDFEASDFGKLDDALREVYGASDYYFFDEVQNVQKWELFVRALLDKKKRIVITGSNASLLSRELGTRLTGRHLTHEMLPFSFGEFLRFRGSGRSKAVFLEYFVKGGFPEYLKFGRAEILHELLNDILMRDIAVRHGIRNTKTLREMALYLLTNIGEEFSYNSLKKTFSLGSVNTAIDFVSYLEDSYLLFTIPRFNYSMKKRLVSPKKAYSIDNGFSRANSASFSEDRGRMLENAVFLGLRRKSRDIFYFREEKECDFVLKEKGRVTQAIQACYDLNDDSKNREISGLLEAMEKFNLHSGTIVTLEQEDELNISGKSIAVTPVWKWLLEPHGAKDARRI